MELIKVKIGMSGMLAGLIKVSPAQKLLSEMLGMQT